MSDQTVSFIWSLVALLFIGVQVWDLISRRRYKNDMIKEILAKMNKKVVIIHGRCDKCGERIPDEQLTDEDLKKNAQNYI